MYPGKNRSSVIRVSCSANLKSRIPFPAAAVENVLGWEGEAKDLGSRPWTAAANWTATRQYWLRWANGLFCYTATCLLVRLRTKPWLSNGHLLFILSPEPNKLGEGPWLRGKRTCLVWRRSPVQSLVFLVKGSPVEGDDSLEKKTLESHCQSELAVPELIDRCFDSVKWSFWHS